MLPENKRLGRKYINDYFHIAILKLYFAYFSLTYHVKIGIKLSTKPEYNLNSHDL